MRTARLAPAAALAALLAAGCQPPDVGQRCQIAWGLGAPAPTPDNLSSPFVENGNEFCDNLVCIVSPTTPGSKYNTCSGDACGYCSKPCVSDADCSRSETDLACQQILLDPDFLARLDPAVKAQYLRDFNGSYYCVVPQP